MGNGNHTATELRCYKNIPGWTLTSRYFLCFPINFGLQYLKNIGGSRVIHTDISKKPTGLDSILLVVKEVIGSGREVNLIAMEKELTNKHVTDLLVTNAERRKVIRQVMKKISCTWSILPRTVRTDIPLEEHSPLVNKIHIVTCNLLFVILPVVLVGQVIPVAPEVQCRPKKNKLN